MLRIFRAFTQTEDRLKVRMAAPALTMQHHAAPAMQLFLSRRNLSGHLRVRLYDACRGEIRIFFIT